MNLSSARRNLSAMIYDVRSSLPEAIGITVIPLAFIGIGVFLYRNAHLFNTSRAGFFALGLMFIGGLATLFVVAGSILPYIGLRLQLSRGNYRIVQGTVTDFVPGDLGGHQPESWSLQTSSGMFHYVYNPSVIGVGGYDQTAGRGGVVRGGLRVRVLDVGGRIARLEVAH
jgi:hypothetical protein